VSDFAGRLGGNRSSPLDLLYTLERFELVLQDDAAADHVLGFCFFILGARGSLASISVG
jgi:hypothetical protein